MAVPKNRKCENGCDKYIVKDGLCYACYKNKHGQAPYPKTEKVSKKRARSAGVIKPDFLLSPIYLDARSALQNLGYKKPLVESSLVSIQNPESLSLEEVIKQALKIIGNPKGLIAAPPPRKGEVSKPLSPTPTLPGNDGTYIISVDFTRYPKLHDVLIRRAEDEIREPGAQLMYMLRETLQGLEERAQ